MGWSLRTCLLPPLGGPTSPDGRALPRASICTCARPPRPHYLVESDCVQGKGALRVQAAAAMRSREEQQAQENGQQWGERNSARHRGSHHAGLGERETGKLEPERSEWAVTSLGGPSRRRA